MSYHLLKKHIKKITVNILVPNQEMIMVDGMEVLPLIKNRKIWAKKLRIALLHI
jgi:hypothetical protein